VQQIQNLFYKVKKAYFAVMDFCPILPIIYIGGESIPICHTARRKSKRKESEKKRPILACQMTRKRSAEKLGHFYLFLFFVQAVL
jgi:hypothetical protein